MSVIVQVFLAVFTFWLIVKVRRRRNKRNGVK